MTKVLLNMPNEYIKNPPETKNCKYCGAEAELGGETWYEWWQHYICCSNNTCNYKYLNKITSGCTPINDIIEKWNKEN